MGEEVDMGLTRQEALTQRHERRHVLDAIRGKVLELELNALERAAEEGAGGNPKATLVEGHERHHIALRRCRSPLLARNDPLLRFRAGRKRTFRHQSLEVPGPNCGLRPVRHWRWGKGERQEKDEEGVSERAAGVHRGEEQEARSVKRISKRKAQNGGKAPLRI